MARDFFKFPSTPHLIWLAKSDVRADKVMSPSEVTELLKNELTVEEKVDGANLGLSFDSSGQLIAQNRGNVIEPGRNDQFRALKGWIEKRQDALFDVLGDSLIVFGEWCYAKHSIRYTNLPDWFLVFDVYDRSSFQFLSAKRRDVIVKRMHLQGVPHVLTGIVTREKLKTLLHQRSSLYDGPREGLYLRLDSPNWLLQRAKIVRADFNQAIDVHWSKQAVVANRLRPS